MRWQIQLPTVSRRHFSLLLAVAVLILGGFYAYDHAVQRRRALPGIAADALQQFRNSCVKEARHANGGGDLVMDDATEAKIGAYCGCVADGLIAKVAPMEIARIADGTMSDDTLKRLDVIVADCRAKLQ